MALFKVYHLVGFAYTYRQRNGFLAPFKNGINVVLWFCLHVISKRSVVSLTKMVTLTVHVNEAFTSSCRQIFLWVTRCPYVRLDKILACLFCQLSWTKYCLSWLSVKIPYKAVCCTKQYVVQMRFHCNVVARSPSYRTSGETIFTTDFHWNRVESNHPWNSIIDHWFCLLLWLQR